MFPEIAELEFDTEETEVLPEMGKSFLYDYEKGDFVYRDGKLIELHGIDALKVWIEKVIRTERDRFKIYESVEYGVSLENYIGSNLPAEYTEMEVEREITESLLLHPYILEILDWEFIRYNKHETISFTVDTPEYAFKQEVNL